MATRLGLVPNSYGNDMALDLDIGISEAEPIVRIYEVGSPGPDAAWIPVETFLEAAKKLQAVMKVQDQMDRIETTIGILAREYGVPLDEHTTAAPDTPVVLYRDEDGWHIEGEWCDEQWAPDDAQAEAISRSLSDE